ncbi:MAG: glycosyltransferase family 4 protein [Nocardioidaceae bacterium]
MLHVAHNCLPHVGGLETVVAAETRGLVARGWEATVLSSAHTVGPGVREEAGVRTVRVRAWNGLEARFGVPFPVFSPWLLVAAAREVRRADLVHVHDPLYLSSWAAVLWCLVLGRPYVVHRHVGFVHHSSALVRLVQALVLGTVGRLVLDRARAVLPIDDHIAAGTGAPVRHPGRVVVLGNGVDTSRFRPASDEERRRAREELGLPADRPLVLFVARFVPKKGFATVAAAASDAYELVFAGDERPAGYDDARLHFLGSVAAEAMPRVYRAADVMVVASVGECPLTVLEALASGLPVVVNDDPALHTAWTAGPGVGFVDMAGAGSGALRDALERLVADLPAARRTGAEGAGHVRTAFSWEAHLDRLEAVYREVLDQTRPTRA